MRKGRIIPCNIMCFLLFVCLPHLFVASPSSSFSCQPDQRHDLRRFKHSFSITGPKVASWREDEDCCSWEGITCDNSTGDVIGLDLTWAGLQGSINSSCPLFSLRHLRHLSLQGNDFLGSTVPPEIGMFTRLAYLNLFYSNISGIVPAEISQLSKLVFLDLSDNLGLEMKDHTMRMLIQNLTQMEELNLEFVDMCTVTPSSFMNSSSSLISLNLFFSSLGGEFPESIFVLPNLKTIELSGNSWLSGILPESRWSPRLDYLSIFGCLFTGPVPNSIGNLSRLTHLDLSYNNFTGETDLRILSTLENLYFLGLSEVSVSGEYENHEFSFPLLRELRMNRCNMSKFPSFLSRSKELINLDLKLNSIQEIPSWLWSIGIDTLEELDLGKNLIRGGIPPFICQMTSLFSVDLSQNNLNGVIPQCLGNLTNLLWLYLRSNSLSGSLPPSLANCTSLRKLDVSYNIFEGPLPMPQPFIEDFQVSYNHFRGSIPLSMCQLTSLPSLDLSQNNLTGLIPQCIGNLTDLGQLDLSNNSLSGPLPPFLANCTSWSSLDVSYNIISGAPPTRLSTSSISYISLRANNFVGWWPPEVFLRSTFLWFIDLSDNNFKGPLRLPSYATNSYFVSNNHFSGDLSSQICNATNLQFLDLSNNTLMGTLPDCLKNVTSGLYILNLHANDFRGQIPEIFFKGCYLKSLDLSRNHFEGSLPRSLSNCKELEALDVGNNNIVDSFPSWSGDLPLKVLSLSSNNFYGHVIIFKGTHNFSTVRVLDLSNNNFEGNISDKFMSELLGMTRDNNDSYFRDQYMSFNGSLTYYSAMINLKGVEMELVKINVQFVMLDLSSNRFQGEIPRSIGVLKSLKGLNLSHNCFTGTIPLSVGNLINLESLDQSSNHLMREIPKELVKLTFLEILDLSRNNLTGPIPSGGHFNTFPSSSFQGNLGLCGIPLTRSCGQENKEAQALPKAKEDGGGRWLEWKYVALDFGSGMGMGISLGYMVLEIGRPLWLVRMVMSFITY